MRLAVPSRFGDEAIVSRDLYIEAAPGEETEPPGSLAARVCTYHAPWTRRGTDVRLHMASVREEAREEALRVIEDAVEKAHASFPNLEVVVSHAAPHRFPDPPTRSSDHTQRPALRPDLADWGRLLESSRRLARRCARLGLVLVIENNWAYWDGIPPGADVTELGPDEFLEYFCTSPDEWTRLAEEVNEPNLKLCLDPSHAGPFSHRWKEVEERRGALMAFLEKPGLIGHFHWNDSEIRSSRGRGDLHLSVGTGDLGEEFHGAIKARAQELPQPVTLEHCHGLAALDAELAYIASLAAQPLS